MDYLAAESGELSSLDNGDFVNDDAGHYTVDDFLDFSKEDETMADSALLDGLAVNSGDASTMKPVDNCNSSVSGRGEGNSNRNVSCWSFSESQFPGNELGVPNDDLAELEWLSYFVEESVSTDDHRFIPAVNAAAGNKVASTETLSSITTSNIHYPSPPPTFLLSKVSVPEKSCSKRSRTVPRDWSSHLILVSPSTDPQAPSPLRKKKLKAPGWKCLHCASEKTPKWRDGPMGLKTLCNACGLRYKSGRLYPNTDTPPACR